MRLRTVIVWSWAVTSLRDLGRLWGGCQACVEDRKWKAHYFSTQGTSRAEFLGAVVGVASFSAATAAALRALRSKKEAMLMDEVVMKR